MKYARRSPPRRHKAKVQEPVNLSVGEVLAGRYTLQREIGSGGYAVVWEAQDQVLDRHVAIKVLSIRSRSSERTAAKIERFKHEATVSAQLDHPNIITIHDMGFASATRPFIVMELLDGHDWRAELTKNGPLPAERIIHLSKAALRGLAQAHSLGVVHKDLKPENIFLVNPGSPREEVRLLDFGLASLKANRASNITESGQVAGTARYMAPEYLKDHDLSPAIDVYQMGLILLEMLTGAPANHGTTMAQCLCIHIEGRLHIPDDVKASRLGPTLTKSLERDPEHRYPDAAAFLAALEQVAPDSVITLDRTQSILALHAETDPALLQQTWNLGGEERSGLELQPLELQSSAGLAPSEIEDLDFTQSTMVIPVRVAIGSREINFKEGTLKKNGRLHALSTPELRALELFVEYPNQALSRSWMEEEIWLQRSTCPPISLDEVIAQLRRTLGDHEPFTYIIADDAEHFSLRRMEALAPESIILSPSTLQPGVLPRYEDAFFGRGAALDQLSRWSDEGQRLVSLTGLRGIGKTRLAVEFCAGLQAQLRFCESGHIRDLDALRAAVLEATSEHASRDLVTALQSLADFTLVLDGLDGLQRPDLQELKVWLDAAPRMRILTTNVMRLGIHGEVQLRLGGLETQRRGGAAGPQPPALEMLCGRVGSLTTIPAEDADEKVLERIAAKVGGHPLAIELLAGRFISLRPAQIEARVEELLASPETGTSSAGELVGILDWSWTQLEPLEKAVLAQGAAMPGGFSIDAAEAIIDISPWGPEKKMADILHALIETSLLTRVGGTQRYSMLMPVRRVALEKLKEESAITGPASERGSGAKAFQALMKRAGDWFGAMGRKRWLDRLATHEGESLWHQLASDRDNLKAALDWGLETGDMNVAAHTFLALARVFKTRGPLKELVELSARILAAEDLAPTLEARVRLDLVDALMAQKEPELAFESIERLTEMHCVSDHRWLFARLLFVRGQWLSQAGDDHAAKEMLTRSMKIFETLGLPNDAADVGIIIGGIHQRYGRHDEAVKVLRAAMKHKRMVGDLLGQGGTLNNLAGTYWNMGEPERAVETLEQAARLLSKVGSKSKLADVHSNLGLFEAELGNHASALRRYTESLTIYTELGNHSHMAMLRANLGDLYMAMGDLDEALVHIDACLELTDEDIWPRVHAYATAARGRIQLKRGKVPAARRTLRRAARRLTELEDHYLLSIVNGALAEAMARGGKVEAAGTLIEEAELMMRAVVSNPDLACLLLRKARISLLATDTGAARCAYQEAKDIFEDLGITPAAAVARELEKLEEAIAPED